MGSWVLSVWLAASTGPLGPPISIGGFFSKEECTQMAIYAKAKHISPKRGVSLKYKCTAGRK